MKHLHRILALTLAIITLFTLGSSAFAAKWTDVPKGSWYKEYVDQVVAQELMNGTGENTFAPDATLSRSMFVTVLNRAAGSPDVVRYDTFPDVEKNSWYAVAVNWGVDAGIVQGYPDGRFGVNDPLTREQMVTILYRYTTAAQSVSAPTNALDTFVDRDSVSSYAVDAFRWAVSQGLISGKGQGKLDPKNTSTRAEAAAVVLRYLEYAKANILPVTREEMEEAVVEAGFAYCLKDEKIQYDSMDLSEVFNRYYGGHYRLTESAMPEYGTSDTHIYSVCSDYVYKVYLSALGYRLFGSPGYSDAVTDALWQFCEKEGMLLKRWKADDYTFTENDIRFGITEESLCSMEEMREFLANWKENLRPGDVILPHGHAMLYVGNGYVLDCGGSKYDMKNGVESWEPNGSVQYLHKVEECYLDGTGPYKNGFRLYEGNTTRKWFVVLRPLNALVTDDGDADPGNDRAQSDVYNLPNATKSRLEYPGMEIDRTVEITPYGSTFTRDTLTYCVAVSNESNQVLYEEFQQSKNPDYAGMAYENLVVTEKVPAGTAIRPGSISHDGKYENGTITWTLDLYPGETAELRYSVLVTAEKGATIVSAGGSVGNIPSNVIRTKVGGKKLSQTAQQGLADFADAGVNQWRTQYNVSRVDTDLAFAERVYAKAAGVELDLPTVKEFVRNIFVRKPVRNESVSIRYYGSKTGIAYVLRDSVEQEYQMVRDMVVADYIGGTKTYFPENGMTINEFSMDYVEIGDILTYVTFDDASNIKETLIMIVTDRDQMVLISSDGRTEVVPGPVMESLLWKALSYDLFFLLRPSQAVADLNSQPYDISKEPEYGEEPKVTEDISEVGLTPENVAKFQELQNNTAWSGKMTEFAQNVYAKAGLNIGDLFQKASAATIAKNIFVSLESTATSKYRYVLQSKLLLPENYSRIQDMLVAGYRGGPDMVDDGTLDANPTADKLQVGDLLYLVRRGGSVYWTGVYLGDGKMILAEYTSGGSTEYTMFDVSDPAAYAALLKTNPKTEVDWEFYMLLRPSQGYKNINKQTTSA